MTELIFTGQSGARWQYWTDQLLGRGGLGDVYAAEAIDGTPMAVKVVVKHHRSGMLDNRLLRREAEIGRRVSDSGTNMLLPIIDVADTGDSFLLVMARADTALADRDTPIEEPEVISVMTDLAVGLHELHAMGIIHRDLKPANMLLHKGRWKLADFGIARDAEIGTQSITFLGWGSPSYMAPEIWAGKSPTVKTDLYALGCVGFELLKGNPPYTGDDRQTIQAGHLLHNIPNVPGSNLQLRNLITRLLAKDPGGRPQDARAVLERLRRTPSPLTPALKGIAAAFADQLAEESRTAVEQAAREARQAAESAKIEARLQLVWQAYGDLLEIVHDTVEELQVIEPAASSWQTDEDEDEARRKGPLDPPRRKLRHSPYIYLSAGGATLRIHFWVASADGELVAGGCVGITNWRRQYDSRNARARRYVDISNLVYRKFDDHLVWQVCKFETEENLTAGEVVGYDDFKKSAGLHILTSSVAVLTTEVLLGMFQAAVGLQPPGPIEVRFLE